MKIRYGIPAGHVQLTTVEAHAHDRAVYGLNITIHPWLVSNGPKDWSPCTPKEWADAREMAARYCAGRHANG